MQQSEVLACLLNEHSATPQALLAYLHRTQCSTSWTDLSPLALTWTLC